MIELHLLFCRACGCDDKREGDGDTICLGEEEGEGQKETRGKPYLSSRSSEQIIVLSRVVQCYLASSI